MLAFAAADLAISLLELLGGYPEGSFAFRALTKHDDYSVNCIFIHEYYFIRAFLPPNVNRMLII